MPKQVLQLHDQELSVEVDSFGVIFTVEALEAGLTARLKFSHDEAERLVKLLAVGLSEQKLLDVQVGDWVIYKPNGARLQVQHVQHDGSYVLAHSPDAEQGCVATAYQIEADDSMTYTVADLEADQS